MPVFAEIIDESEDSYIESNIFKENKVKLSEGDNFEFVCQSSDKNIKYIISKFEEIIKDLKIDGVFLDRIRYKSSALKKDAIFGCLCDNCKKLYKKYDVDLDLLLKENFYNKLTPIKIINGVYEYEDKDLNNLMKAKRENITNQIHKLYDYFKNKGLKVGLDTFALSIADLVGQDIISLNDYSDFIKPMLYLKTTAPAGIPFELDGLEDKTIEAISKLWNCNLRDINSSIKQCDYLIKNNVNITPSIDINKFEGIVDSNPEYVKEYIDELQNINCKEVVLSWDSMKIDDILLDKLMR